LIISILFYLSLYCLFIYLSQKKKFNFNKYKYPVLTYLGVVTINGIMATTLLLSANNIMFSIGIVLFMISDYILMIHKFKNSHNRLLQANSGCYFIGLLLIALSFI
jgi:uncharacterized membrane protein YhhN